MIGFLSRAVAFFCRAELRCGGAALGGTSGSLDTSLRPSPRPRRHRPICRREPTSPVRRTTSGPPTTVRAVHNVVNAHDTGCVITSQAAEALVTIGLQGISRLRSVVDNNGSGQGVKARVECMGFVNVVGA